MGSLDGFRSASRASSRASSRLGYRENDPEPDHAVETETVVPEKAAVRKSRPSLSERTIESLSQLPSSPAGGKGRRRSSFFNADNSMPPPLRPASAMSNNSRPTTSDGTPMAAPATPRRLGAPPARLSMTAPGKRSISVNVPPDTATPSKTSSISRPVSTIKKFPLAQTNNLQKTPSRRPLSESKTMVVRTPKARPSLVGMFGQAISPPGTATIPITPSTKSNTAVKRTPETARKVSSSSNALREQIAKAKAARKSEVADTAESSPKATASSNALREQIAKAKAAARQAKTAPVSADTPPRDPIIPNPEELATFDFGLDTGLQGGRVGKSVLRKRIANGRADGRLNIAALGLNEIPDDVLNMYTYDPNDASVSWGEVVDLTSIIAADNEIEELPEAMFPDVSMDEIMDADEPGPQFGGVQSLDLHGNILRVLPLGLRRLEHLSKLHLSRNRLSMDVLDTISQLPALRELKFAENDLGGELSPAIGEMATLEVLELQGNKLTALPSSMHKLANLKSLNVSGNNLRTIPIEILTLPLVDLNASKNQLEGTFCNIDSMPHLQELNLANNSLVSISSAQSISLPSLRSLNVSTNRVVSLPDVSTWTSLQALLMGENKLKSLPEGFAGLVQLRTADFTGNDITALDEKIALMSNLGHFTVAANPLRERKFLTMATDEIMRALASRLQPAEDAATDEVAIVDGEIVEEEDANGWRLTPSGTLDLSEQKLVELDDSAMIAFAQNNAIRQLYLQKNAFSTIPTVLSELSHVTVLDLSKNHIEVTLSASIELPTLRELRLMGNRINSLHALTSYLSANNLHTLDVSNNRLSGSLPILHNSFPALSTLLASDNSISEVSAEALAKLKVVNLSNNDIERLEPRIGLLNETLTALEVGGNKFRVPNYQVLGKGTAAVLSWLRDKIPRESWKSDATDLEFFDADDGTTF